MEIHSLPQFGFQVSEWPLDQNRTVPCRLYLPSLLCLHSLSISLLLSMFPFLVSSSLTLFIVFFLFQSRLHLLHHSSGCLSRLQRNSQSHLPRVYLQYPSLSLPYSSVMSSSSSLFRSLSFLLCFSSLIGWLITRERPSLHVMSPLKTKKSQFHPNPFLFWSLISRDVEKMQDINKLLIENILPQTVAEKFLAPERNVEVRDKYEN